MTKECACSCGMEHQSGHVREHCPCECVNPATCRKRLCDDCVTELGPEASKRAEEILRKRGLW